MNMYVFGRALCRGFISSFYRPEVVGEENIPTEGGVILCCNHIDNLDPPFLGSFIERKVHFMAKAELFKVPILKTLVASVGAFPVKRGLSDKQALRTAINLLKDGEVLGLFPEGTRSKTGQLGKGLAGAGFFALKTNAQVVPCAIIGPYKLFGKIKLVYGKPIDMSSFREERKSAEEVTAVIMDEIQQLINQNK